jgi:hypothetical protein
LHRIASSDSTTILSTTNKISHANMFNFFIESARSNTVLFQLFNSIRINVLKTGPLLRRSFKIRNYTPIKFDRIVKRRFVIFKRHFFFFVIFPHPFNEIFSKQFDMINCKVQFFTNTWLKFLSEGYLLVLRKSN